MAKKTRAKRSGEKAAKAAEPPKRAYKVGRGKPPDEFKFKKGQGGNPRGRPKGSRNFSTMVTEAAFQPLFVTEHRTGQRRKMSKIEIGLAVAANKMANGDDKALGRFSSALAQIEREAESNACQIAVNDIDHEVIAEIYRRMQLASIEGDKT
jgi:hypothetical protein